MAADQLQQDAGAGVALLLLDIAAAKGSLAQMQQACQSACEDHLRTKSELQDLRQQHQQQPGGTSLCAPPPAGGPHSAARSTSMAQQLQALHTENLQLKVCLRQETEARQALERKHAALLDLLRSDNVVQLLVAAGLPAGREAAAGPAAAADAQQLPDQAGHGRKQLEAAAAATRIKVTAAAGAAAAAAASTGSTSAGQQPFLAGRSVSSSFSSSMAADADPGPPQHGTSAQAASSSVGGQGADSPAEHHSGSIGSRASDSAYFPQHMQGSEQPQQAAGHTATTAPATTRLPAATAASAGAQQQQPLLQGLLSTPAVVSTWQDVQQPGSGLRAGPAQVGPLGSLGGRTPAAAATLAAAAAATPRSAAQHWRNMQQQRAQDNHHDGDDDGVASLSESSCARSHASDALDSDELDELAGLCDSLLRCQQHARAGQQHGTHVSAAAAAGGGAHHPQWRQQQHECVPGLQALAAQLRQLQEQVAATAQDSVAMRSRSSEDGSSPSGPAVTAAAHALGSASNNQASGGPGSRSGGRSAQPGGATTAPRAGPADEERGIASLQQQLAQRMQEVKQRLSNLCNGMQVPEGGVHAPLPSSAGSPAPAGAAGRILSPPGSASPADNAAGPVHGTAHRPGVSTAHAGGGGDRPRAVLKQALFAAAPSSTGVRGSAGLAGRAAAVAAAWHLEGSDEDSSDDASSYETMQSEQQEDSKPWLHEQQQQQQQHDLGSAAGRQQLSRRRNARACVIEPNACTPPPPRPQGSSRASAREQQQQQQEPGLEASSPVSAEDVRLIGRVPAEVVFSPLKMHLSAGSHGGGGGARAPSSPR